MAKSKKSDFQKLLEATDSKTLIEQAKRLVEAEATKLIWNDGIRIILEFAEKDPKRLAPNINKSGANTDPLKRWLQKYSDSYNNRISTRAVNFPATIPDPIIETIISCRLPHLKSEALNKISFGHRLSMTAENVLGHLLEEYLANELAVFNWHCCWGHALNKVDFVNEDGRMLQVKNRSNSENSAGSSVRVGTKIEKWFRVNATSGKYLWDELNNLHKGLTLSEEEFRKFIVKTLKANQKAMPVEPENPWNRKVE